MRILIADDDELDQAVVLAILQKLGHEVETAADGFEAWTAYDRSPFPLVISDWLMPQMDGMGLCRKIRTRPLTEYSYFILLSGLKTGALEYQKALEEGVDDFLAKPVNNQTLRLRLFVAERILSRQGRLQRLEGFLPMCATCRKVRDKDGSYATLEDYLTRNAGTRLSHTFCPECLQKQYGGSEGQS